MPHSFGYRAATRTLFKKAFKTNGRCPTTTYLRTFKRGDYVDIKVDSSIHKGMPFKHYHGRTGVVFNVTKRAVGVRVNKKVNKLRPYFGDLGTIVCGRRTTLGQQAICEETTADGVECECGDGLMAWVQMGIGNISVGLRR